MSSCQDMSRLTSLRITLRYPQNVKFLATNSGSEKVFKISDAADVLKSKTSSASDEAKAATKKADVASSKISDLMKEIATLTQKEKGLESWK